MHQHGVLAYVPVVGREHVLGCAGEHGVERVARDVESHGVRHRDRAPFRSGRRSCRGSSVCGAKPGCGAVRRARGPPGRSRPRGSGTSLPAGNRRPCRLEPFSSAQASQTRERSSWTLLDFFCHIHSSSSTALFQKVRRMVSIGNSSTDRNG